MSKETAPYKLTPADLAYIEDSNRKFFTELQRSNNAWLNQLKASEARRGEFFDKHQIPYSPSRPQGDVLMVRQGDAAIVSSSESRFSFLGTNGVANCVGLALTAIDQGGALIGCAISHIDATINATKTLRQLGSGPIEIFTKRMIGDSIPLAATGGIHERIVLVERQAMGET